jgi:hypothetical protein
MSIPREDAFLVSRQLLEKRQTDLYERFVRLAEKFQYRDLDTVVADAILMWVEAYEHSDTMRPPGGPTEP